MAQGADAGQYYPHWCWKKIIFSMVGMSGHFLKLKHQNLNSVVRYIITVSCLITHKPTRTTFIFRLPYQQTYQAWKCGVVIISYLETY